MIVYSLLLTLALLVSAPWLLWRMATSGRYRAGLPGRLGKLPASLDETIARRGASAGLIWLHAVSVGEVLAAQRLVAELQSALPAHLIVVSTTTETGQQIARDKLGGVPVFYYPLDFAFAVRRYLGALKPTLFVTVESEFWPRMIVECERLGVPVAVVNARISDRSFPRYMRLRKLWRPLLAKVDLFLAQGEETADRLRALHVPPGRVQVTGNLKYDAQPEMTEMVSILKGLLHRRRLVVAGSLLEGEEEVLLQAWDQIVCAVPQVVLLLAPRHPSRFESIAALRTGGIHLYRASELARQARALQPLERLQGRSAILLDTLGDLAGLYSLADVAFVGGSLFGQGGHNPLEPARFGIHVVMGPSFENFREIVEGMSRADAICLLSAESTAALAKSLGDTICRLLLEPTSLGEHAMSFFQSQAGATAKTVAALRTLVA